MSSVDPLLCTPAEAEPRFHTSEVHPNWTQVQVLAWVHQDTSPCNWLSLETYGIAQSAIPHHYFSILDKHFWMRWPWDDHPTKKPMAMTCGVKCFAPLGAKELDWITRWGLSTVLEHENNALFRGSWSLLKRKERQEHEWWLTVHTLFLHWPHCSLQQEHTKHAGFACFGQPRVRETEGLCSLPGQQTKPNCCLRWSTRSWCEVGISLLQRVPALEAPI